MDLPGFSRRPQLAEEQLTGRRCTAVSSFVRHFGPILADKLGNLSRIDRWQDPGSIERTHRVNDYAASETR